MPDLDKRLDEIEKKLDVISITPYPVFGNQISSTGDEIDLRELWSVLWQGRWVIIATTFTIVVAAVVYALSLPNIYRSEALLVPAEESSSGGLAGMAGQFGGLASIAGINLSDGGSNRTTLAVEVLKSREFIYKFIKNHNLLVPLMAAKGWNQENNELIIDGGVYIEGAGEWVVKPSMQEAYEKFRELLRVSENPETSFFTISFDFYSPYIAKSWVDKIIEDINVEIKEKDVSEAEKSIVYLNKKLEETSVSDLKTVFYELVEEQLKTIMFAEIRDEYAFKTIDEAVPPEQHAKPQRAFVVVLAFILGGIFSCFFLLVKYFFARDRI